ncbi:wax ester/triacylglycerol synthase family O-acyltransferase [Aeromicrobium sp. CTD01-1L150]|uniref:WS/DGAT/MGAT family O-acyltransferase n=1 Tax=Aeromicrobium sp. CTD01-1L150 TaxID=3341830 RepID=UPI0035C22484
MPFMPPTDSMFLLAETREHPMHVGGLQLFEPPDGAGPEWTRDLIESFRSAEAVSSTFRRRPKEPVGVLGNAWWAVDDSIDFDYHIRHSAVPQPGRIRELLQLTSRWHGSLLDRHRPLWEAHVVEGLQDGRVAIYSKIHHSMVDGVSALRLMRRSLTEDPDDRDCVAPWALPSSPMEAPTAGGFDPFAALKDGLKGGAGVAGDVAGLLPASMRIVGQIVRDGDITLPRAPKTIINGPVGGARRFAAQSWEIERIKRVAKSSATTLNDVVLAMVSGALREYLLEQHALPDDPMSAMVPVSLALRSASAGDADSDKGGNATGAIVVNLATDRESGPTRLEEIAYSSRQAKKILGDLTPTQILAFSALQMLPLAASPVPGFVKYTRPPFNVVVSNVPGPSDQMYFNGARLDGMYPVSIVLDGQAINITLCSRDNYLDFGIIGCRRSVPHLQRLLIHLETALFELEQAWG